MSEMLGSSVVETVFWFLIVLTPLVFVHEFGHYWVARRAGVRIEVFSIGFGREIFGFTDRAGTRWKFSLIPLGGYTPGADIKTDRAVQLAPTIERFLRQEVGEAAEDYKRD